MAGAKGRSGGARPGAGRKPAAPPAPLPAVADQSPLDFLLALQNNAEASPLLRLRAAVAAAPFVHQKKGEGGKKEQAADKSKKAATGKYKAAPEPLRLIKRAAGGR